MPWIYYFVATLGGWLLGGLIVSLVIGPALAHLLGPSEDA